MKLKRNKNGAYTIKTQAEAIAALEELEKIQDEINPKMTQATELKKAVTEFAVGKKIEVIQIDGCYYRQITRYNKTWIATDDDIPLEEQASKRPRVKSLQSIVKGKKVNGKPLWQLITKRVPDPDKIAEAVGKGWVKEKEIEQAFVERPQSPFLQRFKGVATDAE